MAHKQCASCNVLTTHDSELCEEHSESLIDALMAEADWGTPLTPEDEAEIAHRQEWGLDPGISDWGV
jgi:RNA polymerase subunit RPABC4/transcription elongation factor Spt4